LATGTPQRLASIDIGRMSALLREIATYEPGILEYTKGIHGEEALTRRCLEYLSIRLIDITNNYKYNGSFLERFFAANFHANVFTFESKTNTTAVSLHDMHRLILLDEQRRTDVENVTSVVVMHKGMATQGEVIANLTLHGFAKDGPFSGMPFDCVGRFNFEKRKDVGWQMVGFTKIRGSALRV
jgi:hypothetical protein